MYEVTLRFKTDDELLIKNLVTAWLEDEGAKLIVAGSQPKPIDLTYVKERAL